MPITGDSHNAYFDEAYFQRGEEKGTAYHDYAKGADVSPTFKEIAEALIEIFRPSRCLEIGCATGAIVRHMNALGVEAYGIDVSEWAVTNRLHDNVQLAGADALPFDDRSFDLVFSCHALEHLPPELSARAFSELDRVTCVGGYQFHMMPIIGTYPYDYDPMTARENLKADPTHNLLEPMEWWEECFAVAGWSRLGLNITFHHDTGLGELSSGQIALFKGGIDSQLMARAFEWNKKVHRGLFANVQSIRQSQANPAAVSVGAISSSPVITGDGLTWRDAQHIFSQPVSVVGGVIEMVVELDADTSRNMRVALLGDSDQSVLEHWLHLRPGLSSVHLNVDNFTILSGQPNLHQIEKFYFGGNLDGAALRMAGAISIPDGSVIPLS